MKKPSSRNNTPKKTRRKKRTIKSNYAIVSDYGYKTRDKKKQKELVAEIKKRKRGLKFIKSSPAMVARARKAGALTSPAGIWVNVPKKVTAAGQGEKFPGIRTRATPDAIVESFVGGAGERRTILVYLSEVEKAALIGDAAAFVNNWVAEHPALFKDKKPGGKVMVRLVFIRGQAEVERTPEQLEYYLRHKLLEVPDTRKGGIKKTAQKRREQLQDALVGIRLSFFTTRKTKAKSKTKAKRRKRK